MVLSRCEAIFFIAIGWSMLTLAAIPFITSCIAIHVGIIGPAFAGFGSLYFIAPGVLSLLSGYKQGRAVLGATLATHVIGIISALGCIFGSVMGIIWNDRSCYTYASNCGDRQSFYLTNTIAFVLLAITSFTASIFGCNTTCCTAQNYISVSSQSGEANQLVVTTSIGESSQSWSQQPPTYMHEDQQETSVQNPGNINYVRSNDKDDGGNEILNV